MEEPVLTLPAASMLDSGDVVRLLDLKPHPEGGHFRETFRDASVDEHGRAASTAIYYLLATGETSRWHRIDAAELWHFYAGASLAITLASSGDDAAPGIASVKIVWPDVASGVRK
jgi:predicted cupin superfamily sugar epimerase